MRWPFTPCVIRCCFAVGCERLQVNQLLYSLSSADFALSALLCFWLAETWPGCIIKRAHSLMFKGRLMGRTGLFWMRKSTGTSQIRTRRHKRAHLRQDSPWSFIKDSQTLARIGMREKQREYRGSSFLHTFYIQGARRLLCQISDQPFFYHFV